MKLAALLLLISLGAHAYAVKDLTRGRTLFKMASGDEIASASVVEAMLAKELHGYFVDITLNNKAERGFYVPATRTGNPLQDQIMRGLQMDGDIVVIPKQVSIDPCYVPYNQYDIWVANSKSVLVKVDSATCGGQGAPFVQPKESESREEIYAVRDALRAMAAALDLKPTTTDALEDAFK